MSRAGLTADRLTIAATDLADEIGFDAVTMTAPAGRVDVQVASLYVQVCNAEDLRTRVAPLALTNLADRVAHALAGRSGRAALAALGAAYREFAQQHPGRCAATRLRLDGDTAANSGGVRNAGLIRAALREYRLGEPDETHAIRLVGSVSHGFVALEVGGGFAHSEPDQGAPWERAIDALDIASGTGPPPHLTTATPDH